MIDLPADGAEEGVAVAAEGLDILNPVGAAFAQGNNVIDFQLDRVAATIAAAVVIKFRQGQPFPAVEMFAQATGYGPLAVMGGPVSGIAAHPLPDGGPADALPVQFDAQGGGQLLERLLRRPVFLQSEVDDLLLEQPGGFRTGYEQVRGGRIGWGRAGAGLSLGRGRFGGGGGAW